MAIPPVIPSRTARRPRAFTLLELLVATSILAIILLLVFSITDQTSKALSRTTSQITAFQGARNAFTAISRQLSQATLNTYYDYEYNAAGAPVRYIRQSDLHYVSGKALLNEQVTHATFFQAPLGYTVGSSYANMDTLLNATGFFITKGKDPERPTFLDSVPNSPPDSVRFRLMQFLQPAENLSVYAGTPTSLEWFKNPLANTEDRPAYQLAENVLVLALVPRLAEGDDDTDYLPIGDNFEYDSRAGVSDPQPSEQNQLPPVVEVVMVAIDENSAIKLGNTDPVPSTAFTKVEELESDLKTLTDSLANQRLNYRVFRTIVSIRGSKWSNLNTSTP